MDDVPSVRLFGVRVAKLNLEQCAEHLANAVETGSPHQVVTINPIMLMAGLENPAYMNILKEAEFVVPDGAGAVWAAKYVGDPVAGRVPGIDLMHRLLAIGEKKGWRVYLLGADPQTIRTAWENLRIQYPQLNFVGFHDGYFGEEQDGDVIVRIREARPDLLFVGRSAATQEPWIHKHKQALGVPVMMGVGGSFDVIAGNVERAPEWMQKAGLEWLYRLIREPHRWRRMLALPKFVVTVVRHGRKATGENW
jgi:N-acetylglucosaminyldiphosphoundecaprenol N-acetyl-beta-D-mannosaminyltransferase